MKIDPKRAASFLRDPGPARIVLLHGEDEGLVRHRADLLTRQALGLKDGPLDDPFRLAWLTRDDHDRLPEEASAISMMGGRRVVRVREVAETLTPLLERLLSGPGDSLVLLEAGALPRRSKLLGFIEAAKSAAALACYPEEGPGLRGQIATALDAAGVRADADALDWLRDHLGGDHASTRGEIEKLILYAGADKRLDLDAVRTCVGDQAATSMDDAAYAATLGDVVAADRAMERAFAEGVSPVGLLRVFLSHLTRMHLARGRVDAGASAETAVRSLRPPVFWKREKDLAQAVATWSLPRIATTIAEIRRVELACKQTGSPDQVITRRLVAAVSRQSATPRPRRP